MKLKIKDKSIVCQGCHTRYTINFKATDKVKKSICDRCKKHNTTEVNKPKKKKTVV